MWFCYAGFVFAAERIQPYTSLPLRRDDAFVRFLTKPGSGLKVSYRDMECTLGFIAGNRGGEVMRMRFGPFIRLVGVVILLVAELGPVACRHNGLRSGGGPRTPQEHTMSGSR